MKGNNISGLKKWRRPEGRPISISSYSLLDYTWSSVLLDRCAVPSKPPCKHRGALTPTKITKIIFVASHFLSNPFTLHCMSHPTVVEHEDLNLIRH